MLGNFCLEPSWDLELGRFACQEKKKKNDLEAGWIDKDQELLNPQVERR